MPKLKNENKSARSPRSSVRALERLFRVLIHILPAVLFFSYFPLFSLGANASMNFEFSLPLVWLVLFDFVVLALGISRKSESKSALKPESKSKPKSASKSCLRKTLPWLIFPLWLILSIFWSKNPLRGVLTAGVLWLIYFAIFGFFSFRDLFARPNFRATFRRVFFGSALVVSAWCWLQCLLDLLGAPREASLLCTGCTYRMFGFPHPSGFAIEPQFMGNLLLAPALASLYLCLKSKTAPAGSPRPRFWPSVALAFVFTATIFLTFSRGAIYSLLLGAAIMTFVELIKLKKLRVMIFWPLIMFSFLFVINIQGLMSEFSKTDDTYFSGVAKVINHLSLGVIDIRENPASAPENPAAAPVEASDFISGPADESSAAPSAENAENSAPASVKSAFSGYVAESTDTRLRLSDSAVKIWQQNPATALFGVGLGAAGTALYENNLSPAPKEIVQNEYTSLLLETGLVGIMILVINIMFLAAKIKNSKSELMFFEADVKFPAAGDMSRDAKSMFVSLLAAYAFSLLFFSGLPNALHIYLLPPLFYAIGLRKKFVS